MIEKILYNFILPLLAVSSFVQFYFTDEMDYLILGWVYIIVCDIHNLKERK